MEKALEALRDDPVLFAEKILDFHPFDYQKRILQDRSKRIVACIGRQTGKTTTIAVKAIHFVYANPESTVLITAPSQRQSMIMFERILEFIHASRYLPASVVRKTRTIVQLSNGSKIVALPCSTNLLRGYTAHMIIADEAGFIPEEVITQVMFPMLATTQGYAIFLSTPWDKNHFFYRAFMDPEYSVHHIKSSECPLITKEFLEEQKRNMTEQEYRMEYEAEFVEATASFFPQQLIRSCCENDPPLEFIHSLEARIPQGEYYAGCDFGKLQDYSVIAVLRKEGDRLNLVYLYEFPLDTPYNDVIGHLTRAKEKFHFRRLLIDQTGVGEPILEEIKQGITNVDGTVLTTQKKEDVLTSLKLMMEQGRIRMPYERRLSQQINEQRYKYSKSGHLTFDHPESGHDDQLFALALANYAYTSGPKPSPIIAKPF